VPVQGSLLIASGVAYYASLELLGVADIMLDGEVLAALNITTLSDTRTDYIFKTGLNNIPHTLSIVPAANPLAIIGLDHLIYTYVNPPVFGTISTTPV
jgi:hypothetical protein